MYVVKLLAIDWITKRESEGYLCEFHNGVGEKTRATLTADMKNENVMTFQEKADAIKIANDCRNYLLSCYAFQVIDFDSANKVWHGTNMNKYWRLRGA